MTTKKNQWREVMLSKSTEKKRPSCFGCMDCYVTGNCSECKWKKECWTVTFGDLLKESDNNG